MTTQTSTDASPASESMDSSAGWVNRLDAIQGILGDLDDKLTEFTGCLLHKQAGPPEPDNPGEQAPERQGSGIHRSQYLWPQRRRHLLAKHHASRPLPPRTRGGRADLAERRAERASTPAHAGRTPKAAFTSSIRRLYPRARGEDAIRR